MTPTAVALLGFAAWSTFLVMLLGVMRSVISSRGKAANSFRPHGEDTPGFPHRLTRAHANCYENLPVLGAVLLYAIATQQTAATDPLAYPFLGLRIAQSTVHLITAVNPAVALRFVLYVGQQVIIVYWLLRLTGLLPQ